MKKIAAMLKKLFTFRVVIVGVEAVDDDCHVCCMNHECAMYNRLGFSCNCKNIMIDATGKCATFMPQDSEHGEFPLG